MRVLPTQRTALVEMTRWSWIIIASAPEVHRALTTACTSCWCTTMSSAVKPSGKESAVRFASLRVTSRAAPRTLVVAAGAASSSAVRVRLERWSSVGAFVRLRASTSFCSSSRAPAFSATRASPSMMSCGRSRSARRSRPWAAWKLIANIRPAAPMTTGTSRPQVIRRRDRQDTGAGSPASSTLACSGWGGSAGSEGAEDSVASGGSASCITGDLARADLPRRLHCASSRAMHRPEVGREPARAGTPRVSLVTLASTQSKENAVPESKGRDHKAEAYTPPRTSKAAEPNPTWWAPVFITLLVLGLLWIVVYYVTEYKYPIGSIGVWNLGFGFVLLMGGFIMTMRWRWAPPKPAPTRILRAAPVIT